MASQISAQAQGMPRDCIVALSTCTIAVAACAEIPVELDRLLRAMSAFTPRLPLMKEFIRIMLDEQDSQARNRLIRTSRFWNRRLKSESGWHFFLFAVLQHVGTVCQHAAKCLVEAVAKNAGKVSVQDGRVVLENPEPWPREREEDANPRKHPILVDLYKLPVFDKTDPTYNRPFQTDDPDEAFAKVEVLCRRFGGELDRWNEADGLAGKYGAPWDPQTRSTTGWAIKLRTRQRPSFNMRESIVDYMAKVTKNPDIVAACRTYSDLDLFLKVDGITEDARMFSNKQEQTPMWEFLRASYEFITEEDFAAVDGLEDVAEASATLSFGTMMAVSQHRILAPSSQINHEQIGRLLRDFFPSRDGREGE